MNISDHFISSMTRFSKNNRRSFWWPKFSLISYFSPSPPHPHSSPPSTPPLIEILCPPHQVVEIPRKILNKGMKQLNSQSSFLTIVLRLKRELRNQKVEFINKVPCKNQGHKIIIWCLPHVSLPPSSSYFIPSNRRLGFRPTPKVEKKGEVVWSKLTCFFC